MSVKETWEQALEKAIEALKHAEEKIEALAGYSGASGNWPLQNASADVRQALAVFEKRRQESVYRIPAPKEPPLPCKHRRVAEKVLVGGEGPDDAGWLITCLDCGSYHWRYCDRTISIWHPGEP